MKRLIPIAVLLVAGACSGTKNVPATNADNEYVQAPVNVIGGVKAPMPKAVVYKTNGDYNDNVAVNVAADGKSLISYPAPTDVSVASSALPVGDGWLLDRRGGIGENTRFLKYTYAEYSQLKQVPTQQQLLDAIIPGARVVEQKALPITAQEAIADPSAIVKYLK